MQLVEHLTWQTIDKIPNRHENYFEPIARERINHGQCIRIILRSGSAVCVFALLCNATFINIRNVFIRRRARRPDPPSIETELLAEVGDVTFIRMVCEAAETPVILTTPRPVTPPFCVEMVVVGAVVIVVVAPPSRA